jgi:acylphosphatase
MKTVEIRISGRVQKVGFRSCVKRVALRLNIRGEVMNLGDGTVQVTATGEAVLLDKFLSELYGCPRAVIRHLDWHEVGFQDYPDFSVSRPGEPDDPFQ